MPAFGVPVGEEALEGLAKDVKGLTKRTVAAHKKNSAVVAGLLKKVQTAKAALIAGGDGGAVVADLQAQVAAAKPVAVVKAAHQQLHQAVSKVGKSIDKALPALGSALFRAAVSGDSETSGILFAIGDHLYRRGDFELADELLAHARRSSSTTLLLRKEPFTEMHSILEELAQGNLRPALAWAGEHREGLASLGSSVEFELHLLQFLSLLHSKSGAMAAVVYSRQHLSRFKHSHMKEIQRAMGALGFAGELASSPYADLDVEARKVVVEKMLVRDNCQLQGMPQDSLLETTVRAGAAALPVLKKVEALVSQSGTSLDSLDIIPADVGLPSNMRFHSVFACPVSREQARLGNPAMLLKCGHVVCRETLESLTATRSSRFKCPTCPTVQSASDAMRLYL